MQGMVGVLAIKLGMFSLNASSTALSMENVYDLWMTFGKCTMVKFFLLDISIPVPDKILDING